MYASTLHRAVEPGPLPIIRRRYKVLGSSVQGRLYARTDAFGTLHLNFQARARGSARERRAEWRAGPIRTCAMMIDALSQGLSLLGEEPSPERIVQLTRRVDRQIAQRLAAFYALQEGRYTQLVSRVEFVSDPLAPCISPLPHFIGWLVATTANLTLQPIEPACGGEQAVRLHRESFLLLHRARTWQLWTRLERANSGGMPSRQHAHLCQTDLGLEEPALIAELMLYTLLQRRGCSRGNLAPCSAGLIPQSRMDLLESRLPQAA